MLTPGMRSVARNLQALNSIALGPVLWLIHQSDEYISLCTSRIIQI